MSKRQLLMIIGVWVMIFLFLGIRSDWDKALALLTGIVILIIAFKTPSPQKTDMGSRVPYVEHKNDGMNMLSKQANMDIRSTSSADMSRKVDSITNSDSADAS